MSWAACRKGHRPGDNMVQMLSQSLLMVGFMPTYLQLLKGWVNCTDGDFALGGHCPETLA